ncbi:MAG: pyruvoyl-dependent arginine decarboxylase [Halobacteriaceae archaeon]
MIRVVWGGGTGPTALASYDAALAAAGVHNYNLVRVSSVIPADATVETPGTAPALGPVGGRLTVVEARATGEGEVAACLGWATAERGGLFYEAGVGSRVHGESVASDDDPAAAAASRVREGLAAGCALREWSFGAPETRTATATATGEYATAVVLGVYGEADPLPR